MVSRWPSSGTRPTRLWPDPEAATGVTIQGMAKEEKQYVIDALAEDAWRMFRIIGEFAQGFESMIPGPPPDSTA